MACKQVVVFLIAVAVVLPAIASATEFVVGDDQGWKLGVDYTAWAQGKEFKVGDTLVFNYTAPNHNVLKTDGPNFAACTAPAGTKALTSGKDIVTLATPGRKWYICGISNHCELGMKFAITVVSNVEAPGASPSVSPISSSSKIATFQYQNLVAVAVAVVMAIMI